jgi:uncharacterized protein YqhQ
MAKKNIRKHKIRNEINKQAEKKEVKKEEFSPEVEKVYKIILKVMSWVVGVCFLLIIILPQFNSPLLDKITKILFYIGIINLLIFIVIEFIRDSLKKMLSRIINESNAKNSSN